MVEKTMSLKFNCPILKIEQLTANLEKPIEKMIVLKYIMGYTKV